MQDASKTTTSQEKSLFFTAILILIIKTEEINQSVDDYGNAKELTGGDKQTTRKPSFCIWAWQLYLLFPNGESRQFEIQPLGIPTLTIPAPCFRTPPGCSVITRSI